VAGAGILPVYASLEPGLSVNEAMRVVFSDRGFSVEDIRPRLVAGLRCRLNRIMDLSSDSAVPAWLDLGELLSNDLAAPIVWSLLGPIAARLNSTRSKQRALAAWLMNEKINQ
jgi:hypothetical protein